MGTPAFSSLAAVRHAVFVALMAHPDARAAVSGRLPESEAES